MWPVPVVPFRVRVKSALDRLRPRRHRRSTHPQLHVFEDSLDLRVELPRPDLASDMRDAKRLNTCSESRPELAAVIGHQKPRRRPTHFDRRLDQLHQILRSWSAAIHLHRDDLAAESVDDRSNFDLHPEQPDLGHIQMPHSVRFRRVSHVCWRLGDSCFRMLLRRSQRTLQKHTSDRSPAHSNARSHNVPRDRPRIKFRLRESLSYLVNEPSNAVVQSVPRRPAEQLLSSKFVTHSLLPITDRVGMHDEASTHLLGRSSSELHDLEDLRSFSGRVVRALVRGLPLSLGSENGQLPLKKRSIVVQSIPLHKESHQRRGVLQHPGPGRHGGAHKGSSDAFGHLPCGSIFAHFNTPTTMSGSAQADNHKHLQYKCFRRHRTLERRTHRTSSGRRTNSWPTPVRADWRAPKPIS